MFKLTIRLGNDAMQTPADVADTLRNQVARAVDTVLTTTQAAEGRIWDINGNTVGRWSFKDEEE